MSAIGDIRSPYASRAKEYIWSTICDVLPRGITPTDEDAAIEINWCFLTFEGKTVGKKIDRGQGLYFRRKLLLMPPGRLVIVVGAHGELSKVDLRSGLEELQYTWRNPHADYQDRIEWSPVFPGHCLRDVLRYFARDAATGELSPWFWAQEMEWEARPFVEPHESQTLEMFRESCEA